MKWLFGNNLKFRWLILSKIVRSNIVLKSLFYNCHLNWNYAVDILLEPILWFVDNCTVFLGPVFIIMVTFLTALLVYISYYVGFPWWWNKSPGFSIVLLIVGNWLLMNVCFHYYKGISLSAGHPPINGLIPEAVSICKKCMKPKPPRTHHCSVCNSCVLKMDHHCPWLNNCVGFNNHRHFFQYIAFTMAGIVFIITFGLQLAVEELFLSPEQELDGHPVQIKNSIIIPLTESLEHLSKEDRNAIVTEIEKKKETNYKRKLIVLAALICIAALSVLIGLIWWHSTLISKGETSIEFRINKSLKESFIKEGKIYQNPYDLGKKENWLQLLGLKTRNWWYLMLPSNHKPYGNGLVWNTQ